MIICSIGRYGSSIYYNRGMRKALFFPPQLATPSESVPCGSDWLFERKFDGYRILASCRGGKVVLLSRNNADWTERFKEISEELPRDIDYLIDGEVIAKKGRAAASFQILQNYLNSAQGVKLEYHIFDILRLEGHDVRPLPILRRKELLKEAIFYGEQRRPPLYFADFKLSGGARMLARICREGGEGILCKSLSAPYVSSRTRSWLKVKCSGNEEFVIAGFTKEKNRRSRIGALVLAREKENKLEYSGRVGTGFSDRDRAGLFRKLCKLKISKPSIVRASEAGKGVIWVTPRFYAQVSFTEQTESGILRHPSFKGLREDKIRQKKERLVHDRHHATKKSIKKKSGNF